MTKIVIAAALTATVLSCKKQETTTTDQNTEKGLSAVTADSAKVSKDSASTAVLPESSSSTATATDTNGEIFHYISNDGKTKFSATAEKADGTITVRNETTGKTYTMKSVPSGSGSKSEDIDGNYFWTHQGNFYFGKGDTTLIEGKAVR